MDGMTKQETRQLLHDYIGVGATGIVEDISHSKLPEFFLRHCNLDVAIDESLKTVREKFLKAVDSLGPRDQAKVVRGVLTAFPPGGYKRHRKQELHDSMLRIAERLEGAMQAPTLKEMMESTWRAIEDAKVLLKTNGPISAVDRVHTAMHGYLKLLCDLVPISYGTDPTIEELFGKIRDYHPDFRDLGKRSANIQTILRSLAKFFTAVNDMRNKASMAHPTELLEEDEAMLAIKTAWTVLHYFDAKVS